MQSRLHVISYYPHYIVQRSLKQKQYISKIILKYRQMRTAGARLQTVQMGGNDHTALHEALILWALIAGGVWLPDQQQSTAKSLHAASKSWAA